MKFKKILPFICFTIGIFAFIYVFKEFGSSAIEIIKLNINFYYLGIFILVILISFVPYVMRFKVILDSLGKKISLFKLIKQTVAGLSIAYLTPSTRAGSEPIRIYLLKKECGVDYPTATSGIILDKFVEIFGSCLYGVLGLILLINLFGISLHYKIFFGVVVFGVLGILYYIYKRYSKGKSVIGKLIKFKKVKESIEKIDSTIGDFCKNRKKVLLKSFLFYLISGVFFIIEFKFLLLSIGVDLSITELIMLINIWGITNLAPTPGSLGAFEGGQIAMFEILKGDGAIGMSMVMLFRAGNLIAVIYGLLYLSKFGIKNFLKKK